MIAIFKRKKRVVGNEKQKEKKNGGRLKNRGKSRRELSIGE